MRAKIVTMIIHDKGEDGGDSDTERLNDRKLFKFYIIISLLQNYSHTYFYIHQALTKYTESNFSCDVGILFGSV